MTSQTNKSKLNRRAFLRWTGASLVAVVGGTVWRAADQGVFSVGQGAWCNPRSSPPTRTTPSPGCSA
jgi:hypothetical protein